MSSPVQDQHLRVHRRSCCPASWLACRQKLVVDRRHRFPEHPWFDADEGVPRPLMAGSRKTGSSRLRHEEGVCVWMRSFAETLDDRGQGRQVVRKKRNDV